MFNPYAPSLGGWGTSTTTPGTSIPSIQGALPPSNFIGSSEAKWVTFQFTSQTPAGDILNCAVTDPEGLTRFSVQTTVAANLRTTAIKDPSGGLVARIEWRPGGQATLELRTASNHIPLQTIAQFLPSDGGTRRMVVRGKMYQWTRAHQQEPGVIRWSNVSYNPPEQVGAMYRTAGGVVCLAIAPSAVAQGLLDVAVTVVLIFSCGV